MKNILITGTSRGIGLATAKAFLSTENYHVIGTSTSGKSNLIHTEFQCYQVELDKPASIQAFVDTLSKKGLRLDGIINNAAILLEDWSDPVINMSQLKQTFDVNVFGTIELTESVNSLLNSKGHIINISSGWGTFSESGFGANVPHYKLSKVALNMYTKLLAKRLEARFVKVSAINPGWVQTDMGTNAAIRTAQEAAQDILALFEGDIPSGYLWHKGRQQSW